MFALDQLFLVQVFFIVLRETLELAIIILVLLAFVQRTHDSEEVSPDITEADRLSKQQHVNRLKLQIWIGGLAGFLVCLAVGALILSIFYIIGNDLWAVTEHYWEGIFSIVASVIISVMGIKILRVTKMQEKWKHKLGKAILLQQTTDSVAKAVWTERNGMLLLPFVTTLREGLEAIVFIGGIGINENTSIWSIVNASVAGIAIGSVVGLIMYRSGNTLSVRMFLIVSTCFLYLVAAGLFSKGVWNIELQQFIDKCGGLDVSETGDGPGSYDITRSIWHVNCCNGEMAEDGVFWMLFTAVLGWTNSATYGSVFGYLSYWVVVVLMFNALLYEERHGRLPLVPISMQKRRIRKRQYMLMEQQEPRASTDTIDSRTPLQG